jgi:hypothetical protein
MRCERRSWVPRQNSLAEMAASQRDVRFTSESGHCVELFKNRVSFHRSTRKSVRIFIILM